MARRPQEAVEQFVAEGRLDDAIAALVEWFKTTQAGCLDDALLLAAEASSLRSADRRGELSERELSRLRLRLANRILALRREAGEPAEPVEAPATAAAAPAAAAPVFVSYNHGDRAAALELCEALRRSGIGVVIDEECMQPGQGIADFIRSSVAGTRATLCIVSRASLASGWVVQETLLALGAQALGDPRSPRPFVALYLDPGFLDPGFRLELTDAIDAQLASLQAQRAEHERRQLGTEDLDGQIARTRRLRNELGTVLERLRTSLSLDLREPARAATLERVVAFLRRG